MRACLLLLAMLCLASCEQAGDAGEAPAGSVTVYAGYVDVARIQADFENFTETTGVRVAVKAGDPSLIVAAVIANSGTPTADVLLTPDVAGIWHAAEEGGLRAVSSERVRARVAARLRDPDDLWTAASYRSADIAYDPRVIDRSDVPNYFALGAESLRGRVCLVTAALPTSRALLAMLIAEHGIRSTESLVRNWIRNLAQPVFASEADLLEAVEAGECGAGIVSSNAFREFAGRRPGHGLASVTPPGAYVNIEGIGVARHARNPELARQLVEWRVARGGLSDGDLEGISSTNVGLAGWHDRDAELLAERTLYP